MLRKLYHIKQTILDSLIASLYSNHENKAKQTQKIVIVDFEKIQI